MNIKDCMTRDVRLARPDMTIQQAAQIMAECDVGALPVGDDDRLLGMITDRDIAIRGVCAGKGPECKVEDVMTRDVKYCFEDESVRHVLDNMGDIQVRRLPVLTREKRLVGIVSLGDLAKDGPTRTVGAALHEISRPGGQHTQSRADSLAPPRP